MNPPDIGMRRCYVPKKFSAEHMEIIKVAMEIINRYMAAGYSLTLRQLYYQFVAKDLIPNKQSEYNRLGDIISDARLAGLVPWDAIEDRTRYIRELQTWKTPREGISFLREAFKNDLWRTQQYRPLVRIEKDAMLGVIAPICEELRVPYVSSRGYSSQSELWRAGRQMMLHVLKGQTPIVFLLGDHDPDGIDMGRDTQERLSLFAGVEITVVRLALNMPQIAELKPPPNPAKKTSARYESYVDQYHTEHSWELDALEPSYIHDLIRDNILRLRDEKLWDAALAVEAAQVDILDQAMEGMS